ncbi:MAG: hypothetical protein JETT_1284 [Candidatus Jettenia ecosi]|uniref:Coenzyme PQQ synthesis protein D (PqqD) n=1 Tax=Candidatus Jettenia ecosi TaxID=2494326 RepID=A0A533QD81_9BACT|nr:MAG: hypothetical protein JETT_1284 [Candidatus Jettenia ecosi]
MMPIRKQGIFVQDIGRETLIYSARERVFHVLNATAKFIWELCDGEHSIEDIEQAVRDNFSMTREYDIAEDVQRTLKFFISKGLLEN